MRPAPRLTRQGVRDLGSPASRPLIKRTCSHVWMESMALDHYTGEREVRERCAGCLEWR